MSPRARTSAAKSAASATVATIGAITQVSVPVCSAASAMRVELALEQPGVVEGEPQPADAERGVLLALEGREGDRLVGAGVEGADHDVPVGRRRPAKALSTSA